MFKADHGQCGRCEGRRLVQALSVLFRLLHRPAHDQRKIRCVVRGPAPQSGITAHPARDGSCHVDSGRHGGNRAQARPVDRQGNRQKNLCLAGGVALNCVANDKLLRDKSFDNIWIQPAAGDAGGALGTALIAHHNFQGQPRKLNGVMDGMKGSYLGPEFAQDNIEKRLTAAGAKFTFQPDDETTEITVSALTEGKVVGWFQG